MNTAHLNTVKTTITRPAANIIVREKNKNLSLKPGTRAGEVVQWVMVPASEPESMSLANYYIMHMSLGLRNYNSLFYQHPVCPPHLDLCLLRTSLLSTHSQSCHLCLVKQTPGLSDPLFHHLSVRTGELVDRYGWGPAGHQNRHL